jgi:hypothetical protein
MIMRGCAPLLLLVGLGGLARADVSLPDEKTGWTGACVARFEQARGEAARRVPLLSRMRVYLASRAFDAPGRPEAHNELAAVELLLDETLLDPPEREPMLVSARVSTRQSSWSDPTLTQSHWTGWRRQTRRFEGEVVLHRPPPGVVALVESVLIPALSDCLESAERGAPQLGTALGGASGHPSWKG